MRRDSNSPALVRLFHELAAGKDKLSAQRVVVLLTEARHPLKRARQESDGRKLGPRLADLLLVERKRLAIKENNFRKGQLPLKMARLPPIRHAAKQQRKLATPTNAQAISLHTTHLTEELVRHSFPLVKVDLVGSERALEEEAQRNLSHVHLGQR